VTGALATVRRQVAVRDAIDIEPDVDDKRHAEDSWFSADIMPQRMGPGASVAARAQTVWEVIADAEIKYRGVWAADGTTTHDAYNFKY